MEKHNLDKLFSEKLESFESAPSSDAWNTISSQLQTKKNKNWARRLAMAASVSLVVISGYYLFDAQSAFNDELDFYIVEESADNQSPEMVAAEAVLPMFVLEVKIQSAPVVELLTQNGPIKADSAPIEIRNDLNKTEAPGSIDKRIDLAANLEDLTFDEINPVLTDNNNSPSTLPAPPDESEPIILASNEIVHEPIQIIYKQGEAEEKSKISKALTFMDDVRKGDKKLLNFNKFKGNLFNKNKDEANSSK